MEGFCDCRRYISIMCFKENLVKLPISTILIVITQIVVRFLPSSTHVNKDFIVATIVVITLSGTIVRL